MPTDNTMPVPQSEKSTRPRRQKGTGEEEGPVNAEPIPGTEFRVAALSEEGVTERFEGAEPEISETNGTAISSSPENRTLQESEDEIEDERTEFGTKVSNQSEDQLGETNNPESESTIRRSSRHRSDDESIKSSPSRSGEVPPSKRIRIHPSAMHQCEQCGKVYKHKNCLTKHGWEHHESWTMTKKWCQTKHQQVQMLEAAHVLVGISSGATIGSARNEMVTTLPAISTKSRKSQAA